MGDLNAKMGSDNEDREHYMGREGAAGVINENGELFGDLCSAHNLVRYRRDLVQAQGVPQNHLDFS